LSRIVERLARIVYDERLFVRLKADTTETRTLQ